MKYVLELSRLPLLQRFLTMFVVSLGAVGNHPFLLASYRAQCYYLGPGFWLVCWFCFSS